LSFAGHTTAPCCLTCCRKLFPSARNLHAAVSDFSYRPRFEPRGYLVVYRFPSIFRSLVVPDCLFIGSHHLHSEGFLSPASHPQPPVPLCLLTHPLHNSLLALSFSVALLARYLHYCTLLQVFPLRSFRTSTSEPSPAYAIISSF
jgi:hypothetical protein